MLKDLDLNQLRLLKEEIDEYNSIDEVKEDLDTLLILKQNEYDEDIRVKFDINYFKSIGLFSPYELELLEVNGINNLFDLVYCDLGSMIGIDKSFSEKLLWTIRMFDCSEYVDKYKSKNI